MCFGDYDAEWYVDEDLGGIQIATGQTVCDECGCVIPKGDALRFVHQIEEWDEEPEDGEDREEYQNEYQACICGACELTRFWVFCHELQEGCQPWESVCPFEALVDYCLDAGITRAGPRLGQKFLRWKLENQTAREMQS